MVDPPDATDRSVAAPVAAGGKRVNRLPGMARIQTRAPSTRYVVRQPNRSIKNADKRGPVTKARLSPASRMPSARPRRSTNQRDTVVVGTRQTDDIATPRSTPTTV